MFRKIFHFFDKLEDHTREALSRFPVAYGIIGGVSIVVFWRGIWVIFDNIEIFNGLYGGLLTVAISTIILLLTGLFVSFFIGDRIILSGLKHEKKLEEKEVEELEAEFDIVKHLKTRLDNMEKTLEEMRDLLKK